jgi:hypothetical protein
MLMCKKASVTSIALISSIAGRSMMVFEACLYLGNCISALKCFRSNPLP